MSAAREILSLARSYGVTLKRQGRDTLRVRAPRKPPDDLLAELRAHKADLLALLAGPWSDEHDERAAIIEVDAGCPRAWAEGYARLCAMAPPGDVPEGRWQRFIDDCGHFLDDGWAGRAAALGWQSLDLFGCDRYKPFARIDCAGLLWLLKGYQLVALTANTAVIATSGGARQIFHPKALHEPNEVLAWELLPDV